MKTEPNDPISDEARKCAEEICCKAEQELEDAYFLRVDDLAPIIQRHMTAYAIAYHETMRNFILQLQDEIIKRDKVIAYHEAKSKQNGLRPRVHGNGFIQLDISKEVRLHIFGDERIPHQKVSTQLHDHTFGFISQILSGTLENVRYSVKEDPKGNFKVYKAFVRDKEDTVLRDTSGRVCVEESKREILKAGDSYSMVAGEFHESMPHGRVVTIITKDSLTLSQGGNSPTVLVPVGQEPDNDFNRYSLPPEELWNIITSAEAKSKQVPTNIQLFREANSDGQWSKWKVRCGSNMPAHEYRQCLSIEQALARLDESRPKESPNRMDECHSVSRDEFIVQQREQIAQLEARAKELPSPRIYTRCPACGNDTLIINHDKHLLCTWLDCPDPLAIDKGKEFRDSYRELVDENAELRRDKERLEWSFANTDRFPWRTREELDAAMKQGT